MRLKQVTLSGFRAFATTTTVDLDADCVVISGANGQGKTSLLDGIFWALTGKLERLGGDEKLVSLYLKQAGHLSVSRSQQNLVTSRCPVVLTGRRPLSTLRSPAESSKTTSCDAGWAELLLR